MAIHQYEAPMTIDGRDAAARIYVREHRDESRYYDHTVIEKSEPSGTPGAGAAERPRSAPALSEGSDRTLHGPVARGGVRRYPRLRTSSLYVLVSKRERARKAYRTKAKTSPARNPKTAPIHSAVVLAVSRGAFGPVKIIRDGVTPGPEITA